MRRKPNKERKWKVTSLERTPFRVAPKQHGNMDVSELILYVEDPEHLRRMGSKKEEIKIDVFTTLRLKGRRSRYSSQIHESS